MNYRVEDLVDNPNTERLLRDVMNCKPGDQLIVCDEKSGICQTWLELLMWGIILGTFGTLMWLGGWKLTVEIIKRLF